MSTTYQIERFDNVIDEIKPILERHWEEIANNKNKIPFKPDYDKYKQLDDTGVLHIATARSNGVLIGYCISFIVPHIHYSENLFASMDVLYLDKEHRGKMTGIRLIAFAENDLRKKDVSVFTFHIKTNHDIGPIMERLGFNKIEYIYSKYIRED